MKKIIKIAGTGFMLLIVALMGLDSVQVAGNHVVVLCDPVTHQYYAPPFTTEKDVLYPDICLLQRIRQARMQGYSANPEQAAKGYFTSESISTLSVLLGRDYPSEWGKDGNWGYKEFEKIPR